MNLPNNTFLQGGKYKIIRFISSGGFGCTYEGEHVMLHKRVAIKEFFVKDFCNRDETTSRVTVGTLNKTALVERLKKKFVEEAVSLSEFNHPNIVRVTDVFEENGTAYYVMDFVDGMSLQDLVKKEGKIEEVKAINIIRQAAEALKYVHGKNRLHLDVKPGNIMVDKNDKAFLIDFGASKQYDEVDGENTSTLLGKTPGYAPIEQMSNRVQTFSPATDIYSLGATLYKLLSGETPDEPSVIMEEGLKELSDDISSDTKTAVYKAMEVMRKNRPQSMDEFLSLLSVESKSVDVLVDIVNEEKILVEETPHKKGDEDTILELSKINDPHIVDLGLSVSWSICNYGATLPYQAGTTCDWDEARSIRKWGAYWRMPKKHEQDELRQKCTWEYTKLNNVHGYKVTGPNGNSIFLPCCGFRNEKGITLDKEHGYYWSATEHYYNDDEAFYLVLTENVKDGRNSRKSFKFSVRFVSDLK